jgi:acyl-CoA thioester hydrolase
MGVVYYSNYLVYFEVGRAEYCRQRGFSYLKMEKEADSFLVVAEARCRYRKPLRYDDEFLVRTWVKELRRRTITFSYEVLDAAGETVHAEGETVHVVTDRDGRPKSFPESCRILLEEA